jgi:hypothetical protein
MKKAPFFLSLILVSVLVLAQAAVVLAAPTHEESGDIIGSVQKIKLQTDTNTGMATVVVTVKDKNGELHTVRLSVEVASHPDLGLVTLNEDGNPVINEGALGQQIGIDLETALLEEQHPVGNALSTFFHVEYSTIMDYHESGIGFGVLTQALRLTQNIAGEDATAMDMALIFDKVMQVRTGELSYEGFYSNYVTNEDGTPIDDESIPTNWVEFRKALLAGDKKVNLGTIMSAKDKNAGSAQSGNEHSNKDKNKDKSNNGKGSGNENANENGKKP